MRSTRSPIRYSIEIEYTLYLLNRTNKKENATNFSHFFFLGMQKRKKNGTINMVTDRSAPSPTQEIVVFRFQYLIC